MDNKDQLLNKRAKAKEGGGEERLKKQHAQGKLSARERIDVLLDSDSFNEIGGLVEHRSTAFGL